MPDFQRFLTRVREDYQRWRGSTDRLCAQRQMLHAPVRQQQAFMEAIREEFAWQCLHSAPLAASCWQANLLPRQLRFYSDLPRLADGPVADPAPADSGGREPRRWHKVALNSLADLGWSAARRRALRGVPEELAWFAGRIVLGRCSEGHWHWPRVVRAYQGRIYSPALRQAALLWLPLPDESPAAPACPCGRGPAAPASVHKFLTKSFSPRPLTSPVRV